jgi:hypothetical protein
MALSSILVGALNPKLDEIGISKINPDESSLIPVDVSQNFDSHPNTIVKIPKDIGIKVTGEGSNGQLNSLAIEQIPPAVLERQREIQRNLAPTKQDLENEVNLAKIEGRDPKFKGFDGDRIVVTDTSEENGDLLITVAKAKYSLREAAAQVAKEIAAGKRPIEDLMINGKIFQPMEFHAHAIMFLDSGNLVGQVKGLADGSGKIHLCIASGGVEEKHLNSNPLADGLADEITEEVGNVGRFGLKPRIIGISHERIAMREHAITNYFAGLHELTQENGGRISEEQMLSMADEQFRIYSEQTLPNGEKKGLHLWEVAGYPIIDLKKIDSIVLDDNQNLFINCRVITPQFNEEGVYTGVAIETKSLQVQPTIAPMIRYYGKYL